MSDHQRPPFPPRSERLQQKRQADKEKKAKLKEKIREQQQVSAKQSLKLPDARDGARTSLPRSPQASLPPLESLLGKKEMEAGRLQKVAAQDKAAEPTKPNARRKWLRVILIALLAIVIFLIPSAVLSLWNHFSSSGDRVSNINERQTAEGGAKNEGAAAVDGGQQEASGEESGNGIISEGSGVAEESSGRVRLAFVGDVLLGSTVEQVLQQYGHSYPYEQVREALADADLLAANLETPITDGGVKGKLDYAYRSSPEVLPAFRQAGFDLVTLANNHILDYGTEGLQDTLSHLTEQGIAYVGAGENAAEAYRPHIQEINGVKIAFLGFSQVVPDGTWKAEKNRAGVADSYGYDRPLAAISEAREQADLVVVMAHWGGVREQKPNARQQYAAHAYIDAGADLVIGAHPHVLQGLEQYKDKWIAYSLGNFIFTTNEHSLTWETAILYADCDQEGTCGIELLPVQTEYAQPRIMDDAQAATVLQRLDDLSGGVEVRSDGTVHAAP